MSSAGQAPELLGMIALVKTLTNVQMKEILRSQNLTVSGVKSTLQLRIIACLERFYQNGQMDHYDRLKRFIYSLTHRSRTPSSPATLSHQPQSNSSRTSQAKDNLGSTMSPQPFSNGRLSFKESPFYSILEPLSSTVECKVREQTRDTVELKFALSSSVVSRLQNDPNLRIMVFCAADTGLNQFSKSDVAFPHQVELRANLDEVKANLRGLKNKPGTTRPADVTNYIRKKVGYSNNVSMTFALTQKKFYVVVNLVKRRPVEDLVEELKARKTISKEQVLREMRSRADDADIVATSSVMSLKCPLSTLRIEVPCRSVLCTHHQCFDASSFLQLQEQAPTWTCPVCNKSTSFESLQIDQYVDEILQSTSSDVEQVTIEPTGAWYNTRSDDQTQDDEVATGLDDDFIEIGPFLSPRLKREEASESTDLFGTPSTQDGLRTPNIPKSSQKRSAPVVIDLTGSDEDETPSRPTKRQALDTIDRGSRGSRNIYQNGFTSNGGHEASSSNGSRSSEHTTLYIDV
ncbi:putative SUMO ligase SizA [Talaromyces proteolyticus]|uniref:SUMO ligase SizA n=1 Tax=Talaromyces proteolyticus TaxID=1131652 RepID=A0AAD4KDP2_9EURO|nr:putative SUMO ligase SizA [Talaromyces proteolyticus]KAH8689706.1 putative SUMO ligase SizA [Talaromyces proteolyticus]